MDKALVFNTLLAAFRGIAEDLHYKPLAHALNLPYRVKTSVNDDRRLAAIQFCINIDLLQTLMSQISLICFTDGDIELRADPNRAHSRLRFRRDDIMVEISGEHTRGVGWKFFIVIYYEELASGRELPYEYEMNGWKFKLLAE